MKNNVIHLQADLFGKQHQARPVVDVRTEHESVSTLVGRYAEFMVCAYLTKLGHRVMHVDSAGFDLLLHHKGYSFRLDVKSSEQVHIGPRKHTVLWHAVKSYWSDGEARKRRRPLTERDCDMLALFYPPLQAVAFHAVTGPTSDVRIPMYVLRSDVMGEASLKSALAAKRSSAPR